MRILTALAVGIVLGANWKKISKQLEIYAPVLKDVGEKASDVYAAAQAAVLEKLEGFADAHEATAADVKDAEGSAQGAAPDVTTSDVDAPVADISGVAVPPKEDVLEAGEIMASDGAVSDVTAHDKGAAQAVGRDSSDEVLPAARTVTEDWKASTAATHASS